MILRWPHLEAGVASSACGRNNMSQRVLTAFVLLVALYLAQNAAGKSSAGYKQRLWRQAAAHVMRCFGVLLADMHKGNHDTASCKSVVSDKLRPPILAVHWM